MKATVRSGTWMAGLAVAAGLGLEACAYSIHSVRPGNAPAAIPSLNSPASDTAVTLTPDELQAFVASTRPGGPGGIDIFYAWRPSTSAGFSTPVPLNELNTASNDTPTWASPDGCTLYFATRDRAGGPGGYDTFVATRGK